MTNRDVIVVGASAGGVEAMRVLCAGLPADLPAAVLMVLHMPRASPSALPSILGRVAKLPVTAALDGEPLRRGRIYIAPVDRHLLVIGNRIRLSAGPAENGHRPAIDPLFRSAASSLGKRVIGVVLSGSRDDGSAGLGSIVRRGGVGVVQDPDDALYPWMPIAAMAAAKTEHVVPVETMGPLLAKLTQDDVTGSGPPSGSLDEIPAGKHIDPEAAMTRVSSLPEREHKDASPAGYGCPSCGGSLFQIDDGVVPRYRCRIGHAWSPETLLDEQAAALESALWVALRALEEKADLSHRLARRNLDLGNKHAAARFQALFDDSSRSASVVRDLIDRMGPPAA